MAKIKIEDLPQEMDLSDSEMKKALGGLNFRMPRISLIKRTWATPGAKIVTPGMLAQETRETSQTGLL